MTVETILKTTIDQDLFLEFGTESALVRYLLKGAAWDYCQSNHLEPFIITGFRDPESWTIEITIRVSATPNQITWLRLQEIQCNQMI